MSISKWKILGSTAMVAIVAIGGIIRITHSDDPSSTDLDVASEVSSEGELSETTTTSAPKPVPEAQGFTFEDVTSEAGLDQPHSDLGLAGEAAMTSGVAVADINGDGRDDIYLTRVGLPNLMYLNNGDGTFTDVAEAAGVQGLDVSAGSSAAAFADIEGDGDLDLYVASAGNSQNVLYLNNGDSTFTGATTERGLELPPLATNNDTNEEPESHTHGVTFGDVNNDGFMDLLVLQWFTGYLEESAISLPNSSGGLKPCEVNKAAQAQGVSPTERSRSRLFINDGTGHFSDQTAQMGLELDKVVAFTGQFGDFDQDGFLDLAVTGDGCTSKLYRNVGGTGFEDVTEEAGVGTDENGMGSIVDDFNGDGLLDWFITAIYFPADAPECSSGMGVVGCSGNRLYLNEGGMKFSDATDQFSVREGGWGWGAVYEDFIGSGQRQLIMTNGYNLYSDDDEPDEFSLDSGFFGAFTDDPMRAWFPKADGTFVEGAAATGLGATAVGHGLAPLDFDGDGVLDLLVTHSNSAPLLYRGISNTDNGMLEITLSDSESPGNRNGVGARVSITLEGGTEPVIRWMTTDGSYETQKSPRIHLGLGAETTQVSKIEVQWLGSEETTVVNNIEAGKIEIER